MNTEHQRLTIAAEVLDRHAPAEVAQWFADGVEAFKNGQAKTLCGALKLRARGQNSISFELAREARDHWIREAYVHVSTVCELKAAITSFETRVWRNVMNYSAPPPRLTAIQIALFRAMKTGLVLPNSERQLATIVATKRPNFIALQACFTSQSENSKGVDDASRNTICRTRSRNAEPADRANSDAISEHAPRNSE